MISTCDICDTPNVHVTGGAAYGIETRACTHCSGHPEDCQACGGYGDIGGETCCYCRGTGWEQER